MTVRPKMQVDVSNKVKARAKAVAADREITLSQLVLTGLSKVGDEKLAKLVKEEIENRNGRGRPASQ
jgi:antitoxin component of RelBE/YafQ-DinJ toxin-antitoxin module